MDLQVLISTMNQKDYSLLDKMHIQSDAIIINQCDKIEFNEFNYNDYKICVYSFNEKGIGLSRNNALMRASKDINLFADDDVIYVDNYKEIILKAFEDKPEADMIIFNVPSLNPLRPTYIIKKHSRVRWFNCLRYGAVKIAIRTEKLKKANVYFSLLFGGGAKYSAGEDCLFIAECIRSGLKVYANPTIIGYVNQAESTWFKGYNEKFFIDKGVFFFCYSKQFAHLLCLQNLIRHRTLYPKTISFFRIYKLMIKGIESLK